MKLQPRVRFSSSTIFGFLSGMLVTDSCNWLTQQQSRNTVVLGLHRSVLTQDPTRVIFLNVP